MVKLFSTDHTFEHPFDRVTSAFWRKYPNQYATHLKAIDIVDRRLDSQGRMITNRIQSCTSNIPAFARSAGLPTICFVAETSVVDPEKKEMVVKSSNITGSSILTIEESCEYRASATHARHTDYHQEVKITSFLPLLAGRFEQHTFQGISSKSKEGIQFVEQLCQRISKEGVLSLLENAFHPANHTSTSSSSSSSSSTSSAAAIASSTLLANATQTSASSQRQKKPTVLPLSTTSFSTSSESLRSLGDNIYCLK